MLLPHALRAAQQAAPGPSVNNKLYMWGVNNEGNLGLNDTTTRSEPTQVGSLATWQKVLVPSQAFSGSSFTIALKSDGTLWGWGSNNQGVLMTAISVSGSTSSPVQLGSDTDWASFAVGPLYVLAVKTNGTLWGWGSNEYGQLGRGADKTNKSSPVQVGSLSNWAQVSIGAGEVGAGYAVKTNGTLWIIGGIYADGCAGIGIRSVTRSSPVQIGSLSNWAQVSAGFNTCFAIKTDGTLWAWGNNARETFLTGFLGTGDVFARSSPVQIGTSISNWAQVSAGNFQFDESQLAVTQDGKLYVWGINSRGQLGLDNRNTQDAPVQNGSDTNWRSVATGYRATYAIKTNGTLWASGENVNGTDLGTGGGPSRSSPTQIGSSTKWEQVSAGGSGTRGYAGGLQR
jgi:alpha-tubulin suppressor-like RCC1 family protein